MTIEVVNMRDCASNFGIFKVPSDSGNGSYTVSMHGESGGHCTCKAWEFSPMPKNCKHIERVYTDGCMFNRQYNDGNADPKWIPVAYNYDAGLSSDEEDCCPACKGPTVIVRRGV